MVTDEVKRGPTTMRGVTPDEVVEILPRTEDVFFLDGVALSMTIYCEFPRCAMMLVLDDRGDIPIIRPLHALEMWRVQQLPEEWYHRMVEMVVW